MLITAGVTFVLLLLNTNSTKKQELKFFSIIGHIIMQYQFFPGFFGYYGELRKRFNHFPHQISMCLFRFRFFVFLEPPFPGNKPPCFRPPHFWNLREWIPPEFQKNLPSPHFSNNQHFFSFCVWAWVWITKIIDIQKRTIQE